MKFYLLLILSVCLTQGVYAQSRQLPNGSFENWSTLPLYDNPTSWGSSNTNEYRGVALTQKSTDAFHGLYAAKISSAVIDHDSVFGYVYQGTVGENGPNGGMPLTDSCNRLRGYFKCHMAGGDTAFALVMKYSGGTMITTEVIPISSAPDVNSWTLFNLSFDGVMQDAIFFGFIIGNPFLNVPPAPGSWLLVDSISLSHNLSSKKINIPNPDFENWDALTYKDPDNWYSYNMFAAGAGKVLAKSIANATQGSFAVQVQSDSMNGHYVPGLLSLAPVDLYAQMHFVPYNGLPGMIQGKYQYMPNGTDTANVLVRFRKNGADIATYYLALLPTSGSYTNFSLPFSLGTTPDSINVMFFAGEVGGSTLWLDEVQFAGGNVGIQSLMGEQLFNLYPNPASGQVQITFNNPDASEAGISISNMASQSLLKYQTRSNNINLPTDILPPGIYVVRLQLNNSAQQQKLIVY